MASNSPRLLSLATAVPPIAVRQEEVKAFAARLFTARGLTDPRLLAVFDHTSVATRHLCVPLEWLEHEHSFGEKNDLYIEHALALASDVARSALERAGLAPRDIDHIVLVSTTGLATPTLDARMTNALDFRRDVRRTPLWGLGCAGGAGGVSRAMDFARAHPASRTLVIAVELCSLAFQPQDELKLGMVSASLFADGAAAAIVAGADAPGRDGLELELVAAHSVLWPDSLGVMGWNFDEAGFHLVMTREIPSTLAGWLRPALDEFLARHGHALADIAHVVPHPGGGKVLDAMTRALGLREQALRHARGVLQDYGNMSSPTCLFVLERFLESGDLHPGDLALMTGLGPGFAAESVLMRVAAP
ncbi:MAG: 3-oxoacyl-[acyl-carrier-protein] synthase III C-terminal domain-containing protein [Candidatus Eisenbacteria bacterium]